MRRVYIDKKTLIAAKKGDVKAFEHIMTSYFYPVFSYVYHMIENKEETADLVQESFLKIYANFQHFDLNRKFSTWLFSIVQHTVYDWLRKKRKTKGILALDNPDANINIEEKSGNLEEKLDIEEAISHLSPPYKEVIFLYYWQGYSYKEISEILNKPMNTVKTLLKRAKEQLRNEM